MGKYSGYMICTDLDGTFTQLSENQEMYISRENIQAVECFKAEGGLFTFSTGRRPDYIKENIFPFVKPNAPMITVNGASIFDWERNEILKSVFLPKNVLDAPLIAYQKFRDSLEEVYIIAEREEFCLQYAEENFKEKYNDIICRYDNWYKFVFRGINEEKTVLFQNFLKGLYSDNCSLPRSWETGQEILSINATKGERAKELKEMYPDVHTLICVGDYENDISMIEVADKGYAVSNAIESVLKAADYITVANTEGAIAKIIEEI